VALARPPAIELRATEDHLRYTYRPVMEPAGGRGAVSIGSRDTTFANRRKEKVVKKWNWKRILKFVTVLSVLVALLSIGVSAAWFTDSAAIASNYVTTGNLSLEVGGGPFKIENLEPGAGYSTAGYFYAKNIGDYDMKWRGRLTNVVDANGLRHYLRVRCVMNPTGHVGNYGPSDHELFTNVPLTNLMPWNSYILLDDTTVIPGDWFEPGHYAWYEIQVKLISSAPNAVQGKWVGAKLDFGATQRINPGWVQ